MPSGVTPRRAGEFTVAEVAQQLGLHEDTVRRYLAESRKNRPRLRGTKRGRAWVVKANVLEAFKKRWQSKGGESEAGAA